MVLSPADLTEQLRQRGFLPTGNVLEVVSGQRFEAFADIVLRLALVYSKDAPFSAPETLICKQLGPAWYEAVGLPELRFYTEFAPLLEYGVVPEFYGTIHHPFAKTCTLLLEDLVRNYERVTLPVTDTTLAVIVDTLARHHAFWWNRPELFAPALQTPAPGGDVTRMPHALNAEGLQANEAKAQEALEDFVRTYADELTPSELHLLQSLRDRWVDSFRKRLSLPTSLTLLHGDFHLLGNIFFAKDIDAETPVKIIDWAQVKPGLGPHDLMYMLLSVETPERVVRDIVLLERYYAGLKTYGVTDYAWEQCVWDYRFSLLTSLFQAVFQQSLRWFRKTAEVVRVWDSQALLG